MRTETNVTYHDISMKLSEETLRWRGIQQPFELIARSRMIRGDHGNSSSISMSAHCGTHVDAPFHFVDGGATIDELPIEPFLGPALVHTVDDGRYITRAHVDAIDLQGETRVLFKTPNSRLLREPYTPDFTAFDVGAAEALVAAGVRLVGLDYLSVAHEDEQVPVHRAFLDHGVVLLEGIDLSVVDPGRYELICLPLRVSGSDGAPCRAVLRDL